jgi:hypothetical protein
MDLSKLAPSDAVVALRSLERRYRGLFAGLGEDESPDEIARRRSGDGAGDGWSALEHVVAAARAIDAAGRALEAVVSRDVPQLDPTDADPAARPRPGSPSGTLHERLAELGIEAGQLADRIEHLGADAWDRVGVVSGSGSRKVSALELVRAAVDAGIGHLRGAEQVLAQVRR